MMALRRSVARQTATAAATSTTRTLASAAPSAPATFSEERMASDKRYQATGEVPDIRGDFESPYSIGGQFKEGRAAYLDHSATTPLDPRVLDAMAPFMVSPFIACLTFHCLTD